MGYWYGAGGVSEPDFGASWLRDWPLPFPAALIALPWYARDVAVYSWPDFLGLNRHDQIVVGQPRTGDWLAQYGLGGYLQRLVEFTFKSFWGVFGWLGVFMDSRAYFVLLLLCGIALDRPGGPRWCGATWPRDKTHHAPRTTHHALILLATSTLLTLLVYAWYNLRFVQHQGRYLFTALIPIAIFFSLGWEGALRPRASRILAAVLVGFGFGLAAWGGLTGGDLPKWPLAITVAFAAGLLILDLGLRSTERGATGAASAGDAIPERDTRELAGTGPLLAFALPFVMLPLLDLYALFGAIVPQLTR